MMTDSLACGKHVDRWMHADNLLAREFEYCAIWFYELQIRLGKVILLRYS